MASASAEQARFDAIVSDLKEQEGKPALSDEELDCDISDVELRQEARLRLYAKEVAAKSPPSPSLCPLGEASSPEFMDPALAAEIERQQKYEKDRARQAEIERQQKYNEERGWASASANESSPSFDFELEPLPPDVGAGADDPGSNRKEQRDHAGGDQPEAPEDPNGPKFDWMTLLRPAPWGNTSDDELDTGKLNDGKLNDGKLNDSNSEDKDEDSANATASTPATKPVTSTGQGDGYDADSEHEDSQHEDYTPAKGKRKSTYQGDSSESTAKRVDMGEEETELTYL